MTTRSSAAIRNNALLFLESNCINDDVDYMTQNEWRNIESTDILRNAYVEKVDNNAKGHCYTIQMLYRYITTNDNPEFPVTRRPVDPSEYLDIMLEYLDYLRTKRDKSQRELQEFGLLNNIKNLLWRFSGSSMSLFDEIWLLLNSYMRFYHGRYLKPRRLQHYLLCIGYMVLRSGSTLRQDIEGALIDGYNDERIDRIFYEFRRLIARPNYRLTNQMLRQAV